MSNSFKSHNYASPNSPHPKSDSTSLKYMYSARMARINEFSESTTKTTYLTAYIFKALPLKAVGLRATRSTTIASASSTLPATNACITLFR